MKYLVPISILSVSLSLSMSLTSCANISTDNHVDIVGNKYQMSDFQITDLHSINKNGVFEAQATLLNTSNSKTIQIYYRCVYFDKNSFRIESSEQWQPVLVYANQKQYLTCNTANPKITSFKIEVSSSGEANNTSL